MSFMRHIQIVPYDESWPGKAENWKAIIGSLLGEELIRIEHIGSTSVPGLAAKPVIDLMPLVHDISMIDPLKGVFEQAGFAWYGEYGLPGRRYVNFDVPETGLRVCNVHIYAANDIEVQRHLVFPAYLRAKPKLAVEYALLKDKCAARHPNDVNDYNDCKNDWIKAIQKQAQEWWTIRPT